MTESTIMNGRAQSSAANTALKVSTVLWFLVAIIGQWIFAFYVVAFYGGTALRGSLEAWNKVLIHGILPGDPVGNFAVITHLLLAVVITIGGPLQLIPQIRNRFPIFHHWNGRVFLLTAFAISIGGLYMIWTRGTIGSFAQHIAISLNAVLIIVFAALTLRNAIARKIDVHRRWALRLFLAVSGVWFFRVGLMLWFTVHQAPVGIGENFDGPFVIFLAFAQYLGPLTVLELYFYTQDRTNAWGRYTMAVFIVLLTIAMAVGIFAAIMGMWLPLM